MAAESGFQVRHTRVAMLLAKINEKALSDIDLEQRQVSLISHRNLFDAHEVIQAQVLFGVTEIELDSLDANDKRVRGDPQDQSG